MVEVERPEYAYLVLQVLPGGEDVTTGHDAVHAGEFTVLIILDEQRALDGEEFAAPPVHSVGDAQGDEEGDGKPVPVAHKEGEIPPEVDVFALPGIKVVPVFFH